MNRGLRLANSGIGLIGNNDDHRGAIGDHAGVMRIEEYLKFAGRNQLGVGRVVATAYPGSRAFGTDLRPEGLS